MVPVFVTISCKLCLWIWEEAMELVWKNKQKGQDEQWKEKMHG